MKGKTIIELKDVKTGAVKRVEHGNTFQTAVLEKLFKPMGALGLTLASVDANQWQTLVGGIMAFDKTIEIGTQYPPQDVNMIANGAYNVVNNGNPTELGTWNASESSVSKDEIVMTYDYTTSQGNGTINSVCLTSYNGGLAGIGNASNTALSESSKVNPYVGSYKNFNLLGNEKYLCIDDSYIYVLDKDGTTLSIKKRWTNISGIDLIRGLTASEFDETYTMTLPNAYSSIQLFNNGFVIDEGKFAMIRTDNDTYKVIVVDVANRSISSELTVPKQGSAYFVAGTDNLQIAQKHTSNDVNYVSIYDTNTAQWISDVECGNVALEYVLNIGGRYYYQDDNSYWYCACNGVLVPTNYYWQPTNRRGIGTYLKTMDRLKFSTSQGYESFDSDFGIPAMYLATINNLEEAIVKDNTKTMKIIYVLTRR